MKRMLAIAPLLLVAGCEAGTGAPPEQGPHAYLLLRPATEQKGWAAIEAMRAGLPADQRRRIRTAGLVSSKESMMYVDFDGTCATDFVAAAQRIAERAETPSVSCSITLPGALQ